jgi:hypothetical protein
MVKARQCGCCKWLTAIAVIALLGLGADESPLTLKVYPLVQPAFGHINYSIRVESHRDNFWLCYGYDASNGDTKRSCFQLNGIYSPKLFQEEYLSLPEGEYEAFVELYRVPNRLAARVTHTFTIS